MPKFAANISLMFNEVDFLDRFEAAAKAGFEGIEYLFPYDYEPAVIRERLDKHGLTQVLFNLYPGDWKAGERGLTSLPDRVSEFQDSVGQAIEYATALGCKMLHAMSGIPKDADRDKVNRTYIDNLRYAARAAKEVGIKILIEPINVYDMPGIYLTRTNQALAVIEQVGADNLGLQYDCYHMQIMEGNLSATIERHLDKIEHIQIAEVPGRHEPGRGEIAYRYIFDHLDRIGYSGWVGCEYRPIRGTLEGLAWFRQYAKAQ